MHVTYKMHLYGEPICINARSANLPICENKNVLVFVCQFDSSRLVFIIWQLSEMSKYLYNTKTIYRFVTNDRLYKFAILTYT